MSDELQVPSFLRAEGRHRVCMFSIMMERGRRAQEFELLGVETVFARLGDGRYPEKDADMMRGWLGHKAQCDVTFDLSDRIEQIEARYALGRRRRLAGQRLAHAVRVGWPLLLLAGIAIAGLLSVSDIQAGV